MSDIKGQLVNNTIWKSVDRFASLGISLICTFVLARFLTPEDYGIVGMLAIFMAICSSLVDSGISQAVIREKEVSDNDYSTVLYFNLFIAVILYIILFLCSGLISKFYHQPILENIAKFSFLSLIINALSIVQVTKLTRELRFKKQCLITLTTSLVSASVTIYLGWKYRSIWVLVFQPLMADSLKTALLWTLSDFRPKFIFSRETIRRYFKFSKNILLSGLIGNIFNNINGLLIGRYYTPTDLGYFSQAQRINNVASQNSSYVIQSVSYPILSKLNNENADIKSVYKRIIITTMICVGCIMAIVLSLSFDLFELLMGTQWRPAGVYLLLLGLSGILYPLHCVNQNILMVKGDSSTILKLEIFRRIIMIVILIITLQFNVYVFAAGLSIYSFALLFVNLHYCGKPINYSVREQLRDTAPIILKHIAIVAVGLLIGYLLRDMGLFIRFSTVLIVSTTLCYVLFRSNENVRDLMRTIPFYNRIINKE